MLSSLLSSYKSIVDMLLYGRETFTINNVKELLNSKELGKKSKIENATSLIAKGNTTNLG